MNSGGYDEGKGPWMVYLPALGPLPLNPSLSQHKKQYPSLPFASSQLGDVIDLGFINKNKNRFVIVTPKRP